MHLALDSQFPEIRRLTNVSVAETVVRAPQMMSRIVREALSSFVARDIRVQKVSAPVGADENAPVRNKQGRLAALLISSVSFGEDTDTMLREKAVVDLIVLAHHQLICPYVIP